MHSETPSFKKDDDLNDVIQRNMCEYEYFRVSKPPYIDDLNSFITNISLKEKKNKELLYFKNLRDLDFASSIF